jgi:tetratricopeptide (TPR) repeat protein
VRVRFVVGMSLASLSLFTTSFQAQDQYFAKGIELQNQGKIEEAIEQYELSIKSRPHFPALANLGAAYARLGRYTEAIDRYDQALKLAPGQPLVLLNLGLAYYKLGDVQKAIAQFDQVLKSDASNHQARTLLADCFFQMGQHPRVIELLEPV